MSSLSIVPLEGEVTRLCCVSLTRSPPLSRWIKILTQATTLPRGTQQTPDALVPTRPLALSMLSNLLNTIASAANDRDKALIPRHDRPIVTHLMHDTPCMQASKDRVFLTVSRALSIIHTPF